jgi:hypothetical protein
VLAVASVLSFPRGLFIEDQFRFQKGKVTKEALGLLTITSSRMLDITENIYMLLRLAKCF